MLKINWIESMDRLQDTTAHVALTFHKLDDAAVELLESLNIDGEPLDINDSHAPCARDIVIDLIHAST